jgi:hypothetical protein
MQFQYQINLQLSLIAVLLTVEFIPKLPIFIVIIFDCPLQNAMLWNENLLFGVYFIIF